MFSRNGLFILIAIYFVFTYPLSKKGWSLNDVIGWHTTIGRPWQTWLFPCWFILMFAIYQLLASKNLKISGKLFWCHIAISVIPTIFFNHPFGEEFYYKSYFSEDPLTEISIINSFIPIYIIAQVAFFVYLLYKLYVIKKLNAHRRFIKR